jgi:hypothetical protein
MLVRSRSGPALPEVADTEDLAYTLNASVAGTDKM